VIKKLESKLESACLRRDAYLNRVLGIELDRLDNEVALANSESAQQFIADRLDALPRKLVTLTLKPELVDRLDDICRRKRIPRDAFFNRLFLLLAAKPKGIDTLFFRHFDGNWRSEVWSERRNDGPFFQNVFDPLDPDIDPFWAIREGIDLVSEDVELVDYTDPETGKIVKIREPFSSSQVELPSGIYTRVWTDSESKDADLYGLNCHLPDWRVPGTAEQVKYSKELDLILEPIR
jgi:hypothetical protein